MPSAKAVGSAFRKGNEREILERDIKEIHNKRVNLVKDNRLSCTNNNERDIENLISSRTEQEIRDRIKQLSKKDDISQESIIQYLEKHFSLNFIEIESITEEQAKKILEHLNILINREKSE